MGLFSNCKPDFSILCIWPWMGIDLGSGPEDLVEDYPRGEERNPGSGIDNEGHLNLPLGHAGILLIQAETGLTRYFEYGRYRRDQNGNPYGSVENPSVPDVALDSRGNPTSAGLHRCVKHITRISGKNSKFHGNFDHKCGGFQKVVEFAESYENPDYNLAWRSCITFAHLVNSQGGFSWFGAVPVFDSFPAAERDMLFWQSYIKYNPETDEFYENVRRIKE